MPSKRPSRKPDDPTAAVDQASNVSKRLLAFLELASGFSLAVAVCGVPSAREGLITSAVAGAEQFGVAVQSIDVSELYDGDFVLAVRTQLNPPKHPDRLAVMVTGIDRLVYAADDILGGRDHRPLFAARINFDRERMAELLPFPIVLWMEREAFRLLLHEAPDLSQWISARFEFDELPEQGLYFLHYLMLLDKVRPRETAHFDLASEQALLRELERTKESEVGASTGKRILLLLALGQQQLMSSKVSEARKTLKQALTLGVRWKRKRVQAGAHQLIGHLDLEDGKTKLAIRDLRKAVELFRETKDEASAASAAIELGQAYRLSGDYGAAVLSLRDVIEHAAGAVVKLDALVELGAVQAAAGEKEKAIDAFEEAFILMGEQNDPRRSASVLMEMGESMHKIDPRRALDYLDRCLKIVTRIGDRRSEARCLVDIGWAYIGMEEYRRAISYFEESFVIYRQLDDRDAETRVLPSLVNALGEVGEFDRAESLARESLERARKAKDRRNEAGSLVSLSGAAYMKGEIRQALKHVRAGVDILREIGDPSLKVARKWLGIVEKGKLPPPVPAPKREEAGPSVAGLSGTSRQH